jgi:hypothetical protein
MDYVERFTDAELELIVETGLIYMCACPGQVADAVRKLRELHRYQLNCLTSPENVGIVHQTIAASTVLAHAEMQDCLDKVLALEGWDRTTLKMPEGLRCRQRKAMLGD